MTGPVAIGPLATVLRVHEILVGVTDVGVADHDVCIKGLSVGDDTDRFSIFDKDFFDNDLVDQYFVNSQSIDKEFVDKNFVAYNRQKSTYDNQNIHQSKT